MKFKEYSFKNLLVKIVDNRGKTCPTAEAGIPLIATNCIKNNALYPVFEKVRYVDQDAYDNWFRGHPEPDDMIFVCKGSPGRVAWVPDPINFCIAQDMVAVRADTTKVYPKYLFALLRSNQTQKKILNMHVGTLIPHFKKGDFGNLYFDIPEDLEYQKKVGDAYYSFCEKIELNRQTNQTLEQIAQAIFKSWFVDFEPVKAKIIAKQKGGNQQAQSLAAQAIICGAITLQQLEKMQPGYRGLEHELYPLITNHFPEQSGLDFWTPQSLSEIAELFPNALVESELGEVPEGWYVGTLNNICNLNSRSWTTKNVPDEVWYVDLANTKNGVVEAVQYYSWDDAPSRAKRVLCEGDTIVGTVRPGNRSFALIGLTENQLTASTGFAVLTPKKQEYLEFVYITATGGDNIDRLAHLADGGAYPAVRPDVVTQVELAIPNDQVIAVFSKIVKPLFQKRSSNLLTQSGLESLRDTLLPKLLSGELSIDNSVSSTEAVA